MSNLSSAHHGYNYQDIISAYALASILLPRSGILTITIDQKSHTHDCFDDLEIDRGKRCKIQIKSHTQENRPLLLKDFTTKNISFRIDDAIRSFIADQNSVDEYRLLASFDSPEALLLPFLKPSQHISPVIPELPTQRYTLDFELIWPEGSQPKWKQVGSFDRDIFLDFCKRFVIEINCPRSSNNLRQPGQLENALIFFLEDRIGIGKWPNHNRDIIDATAHLIQIATIARERRNFSLNEQNVIENLSLRVDYGRVDEHFPIENDLLVEQSTILKEIISRFSEKQHVVVTGPPGIGKSWLLHQLASRLELEGWNVALHFCHIDLHDPDRINRASIETIFGSILAQLLDNDPALSTESVPRFSAGPFELEKILSVALQENPNRKIAILIDGLDHADRLPDKPHIYQSSLSNDIVQELAALQIPKGVVIVIGSQPGNHLESLHSTGSDYVIQPWSDASIATLVNRMKLENIFKEQQLKDDYDRIQKIIIDKAFGNPLYASYLCKMVATKIQGRDEVIYDLPSYLVNVPNLGQGLDVYYDWLLREIASDTGAIWVSELLSLIDFPLSSDEIKQIEPAFSHHIDSILLHLSPILINDVMFGGVRIYHESFQRFTNRKLESDPTTRIADILKPVIEWLDNRGFFSDIRSFRSLCRLLSKAGRYDEIIEKIADDYVSHAISYGQPVDAVQNNLVLAASIAADLQSWSTLVRLIELSRSSEQFYRWRLENIAIQYGKTFSALFGAQNLSIRLLSNGRCTFPPRSGLILCKICEDNKVIPPWQEYRDAHKAHQRNDNTVYPDESNTAIHIARLTGKFRLDGRDASIKMCVEWLQTFDNQKLPLRPADIVFTLGEVHSVDAVFEVIDSLEKGEARAWSYLMAALLCGGTEDAKGLSEKAVLDGIPPDGWQLCLEKGCDPELFPKDILDLNDLTTKVISRDIQFNEDILSLWITAIRLEDVLGHEIALNNADIRITEDSWFHRWLKFCLILYRSNSTQDQITTGLIELSKTIEVFKGNPRVCDLYKLDNEIRQSFRLSLSLLDMEHWETALNALKEISKQTSTWLQRSRTGPLPLDVFIDLCISISDTTVKRQISSTICIEMLRHENRGAENYDAHAEDQMLLARLLLLSDQRDLVERAWKEACLYLSSYGQHKDITVYEILDPLETLANFDSEQVRQCFTAIQPVVERILVHTDGKGTRDAIDQWLDQAANTHPAGALSYLSNYGIERLPYFGNFDHAIPKALCALEGEIDPRLLLSGWIAIGSEAQSQINAALLSCEKVFNINPDIGLIAWNTIVGSLDGDHFNPTPELVTLVSESARRIGIFTPLLAKHQIQETKSASNNQQSAHRIEVNLYTLPVFPKTHDPIHITHGVRVWRDSRELRSDIEGLINAVGWHLLEIIEGGQEDLAEKILIQVARDLPRWDAEKILPKIADGLARNSIKKLSALAYTLTYTRSSDGWRSFAGNKSIDYFQKALELDSSIVWSTLANEVSEQVFQGGNYGVTTHLIEVLATGGFVNEAFDTWDAACKTIIKRVPGTGPYDEIDILYDDATDESSAMLIAAIFARINNCFIHEKRLAVAAASFAVNIDPVSFGAALKIMLARSIPVTTLISLLQIMDSYEPEPYLATQIVKEDLNIVAKGDYVSLRTLTRNLLERAGIDKPLQPPSQLPYLPAISEERSFKLREAIVKRRLKNIDKFWPDFSNLVIRYVDTLSKSDELKEEMQHTLSYIGGPEAQYLAEIWTPYDEEVERGIQMIGSAARTAMAASGEITPSIEETIGMSLLGDIDLSNRMVFSRIVRPKYLPSGQSLQPGTTITPPMSIISEMNENWIVLAHIETERLIADDYEKSLIGQIQVFSCIQLDTEWRDCQELPLGYGYIKVWQQKWMSQSEVYAPFHGPLVGMGFTRDMFSRIEVLVPHPIFRTVANLELPPFFHGLTLNNQHGKPAVICRYWRQRLVESYFESDQIPKVEGMVMLARPDILKAISHYSVKHASYVTCVQRS